MVYARYTPRRGNSSSRRPYRRNYRKKAVPVPKPKRTVRRFTRSNSMAINRLSRKVSWLTQARYGSIQRNFQTSNGMTPLAGAPILTDIMDFTSFRGASNPGCRFRQYIGTPGVLTNVGQWNTTSIVQNIFQQGQNLDQVDTGKYLALSCHVTMRFQAVPSAVDTRIRVDLFSVRGKAIQQVATGGTPFALPTALNQLTNLSNPELNKLGGNPYLKVYATKWLYLSSSQNRGTPPVSGQQPGPAVTGNSGYLSFTIRPNKGKGKLRTQDITVPVVPSDTLAIPDGNFGPFNIAQDEPLYLLISSSDASATGPPGSADIVTVQCSRSIKWRDPLGMSAL